MAIFDVVEVVISDSNIYNGHIISAVSIELPPLDVNAGEAKVALLAMIFALSHAPSYSYLKGILPLIKLDHAPIVEDIYQQFLLLQSCTTSKVFGSSNHRPHQVVKVQVASNSFVLEAF
jgi:flagella basal body P-ring formation protein FlgA